jgi:hypothetical protein
MSMRIRSVLLVGPLLVFATPAGADTLFVTNTNDSGSGSLRAVVAAAAPGDTVVFDASLAGRTITLTSGQIPIAKILTIDGGANRITISGNGASRVFQTEGAVVTLKSLTIRDGRGSPELCGGGIRNTGILVMNDCHVTRNYSDSGGGAGVCNEGGTLVMERCTISENTVYDSGGGGVANIAGDVVMTSCTVSGNVADAGGGGLANVGEGAEAILKYCTVAYNSAFDGGGLANRTDLGFTATTSLQASILAHNTALGGADCVGTIVSNDGNVVSTTAGCTITGSTIGSFIGYKPLLGSLQMNGGLTPTHALLAGSVGMDIMPTCPSPPAADQRGLARPQDGRRLNTAWCDAGAYEAAKPIVVNALIDPGSEGTCTLRQAIAAATTNTAQGLCMAGFLGSDIPDRITFSGTGKITLATGRLELNGSVMIEGPGASLLTISGNDATPVLNLADGAEPPTFVISGVTVADGRPTSPGTGGGLQYLGSSALLAIDRSSFRGGAPDPLLFHGYQVVFDGGRGLDISRTSLNVPNQAMYVLGIFNASARITNSTVGPAPGNGIVVFANGAGRTSRLEIESSTIKGAGLGAGLQVASFNGAAFGSGSAAYHASIFAGFGQNILNVLDNGIPTATLTSLGYNVSTDATGSLSGPGDLPSTDPKLGVLAYNGGQTPTFNTKPGSPAIGLVPRSSMWNTVDQRAFPRAPAYSFADAGAIERVVGGDVNGDGAVDVLDVFYAINFLFAAGPVPIGETDVNGDGAIDILDVFYLINTLFAAGPAPI